MREFQVFCVVLSMAFVLIAIATIPAQAGVREWLCGDGSYRQSCEFHDGWTCQDNVVVNPLGQCSGHGGAKFRVEPLCGDGVGDIGEQCDQGTQNSDNLPNACRTDCRTAYCGDGVLDSGEQCDDGYAGAESPNGCRNDCTLPVCGDGIHDDGSFSVYENHTPNMSTVFNEECDDGNNNNLDGCKSDCTVCLQLNSNINVTADTALCGQLFNVDDYGPEGVIIIQHPGVTLDCDGATLQGAGGNVGIYVMQSDNVTIENCTVRGYAVGIKVVDSQNVSVAGQGNNLSGNTQALALENAQMAPPQAVSHTLGGSMGAKDILKQLGSQPEQPKDKVQTGVKSQSLIKPGGNGQLKAPGRRPVPKKQITFPGVPPSGTKAVRSPRPIPKAQSLKPGLKVPGPGPLGTKSMPPDPLGQKAIPIDPLGTNAMPVDPYGKESMPVVAPLNMK